MTLTPSPEMSLRSVLKPPVITKGPLTAYHNKTGFGFRFDHILKGRINAVQAEELKPKILVPAVRPRDHGVHPFYEDRIFLITEIPLHTQLLQEPLTFNACKLSC